MLQHEEGIAYATFDLNACIEPKQFHDVVGYYNRFDVFELKVNRRALTPVEFNDAAAEAERAQFAAELGPLPALSRAPDGSDRLQ